jgi:hypothetical protein
LLNLARNGIALIASALIATPLLGAASPTPAASPVERLAIASCLVTPFYSWPDPTLRPQQTHYPPARIGDAFHVIGTGTIAPGEFTLVETTIDIFAPYGAGKHYWVPAACIT